MTKEDVLQKVNDYCNEKSYTTETLTDDFKEKFADFFSKKYADDVTFESDGVLNDLQFNLNTAFSATSKGITAKVKAYETRESELKRQIAELNKRLGTPSQNEEDNVQKPILPPIPQELKDKLDRLEKFENEQRLSEKFKEVMSIAKRSVRNDLHKSLESYAADFVVNLEETSEEQAKKLTARFQDIFRESIGDIKPLAPQVTRKRDEEFLNSIPKVKI